jgi:SAM-dependent methyltransferase
LGGDAFDAVTSAMTVHHVENKRDLFRQVYEVLKPEGVFVLSDHIDSSSPVVHDVIERERALKRLGRDKQVEPEQIQEAIRIDEQRQEVEGNRCESAAEYQEALSLCGFEDIDCLWRDYWLAVFVARKPGRGPPRASRSRYEAASSL